MKALLVADDEKAITNISEVLKTAGYDVIVYKWLLKAMDNIEEIAPHLIVISTKDYPRHWKTLAQYSSTLAADYTPEIILYAEEPLPDEEEKKAEALHVRGIFDSCEVEGLDKLRQILAKKEDIFSGLLTEPEQGEVTLQDLLPELSDLSKDIDSLKEDLKKPFNIDEAIAQAKKAQEEEARELEQADAETEENKDTENAEAEDEEIKNTEEHELGTENKDFAETETEQNETGEIETSEAESLEENKDFAETETGQNETGEIETSEAESLEENKIESSETEIESEETSGTENQNVSSNEIQNEDSGETENLEPQNTQDSNKSDIIGEKSEKEDNEMNENDIEAKLAAIMSANKSEAKEKAAEAGIGKTSCSFVFTNPITLAMVTGTARNYNGLTLEFTPDIPSFIMNLTAGTLIDCASLKVNGEISDVKCEIMSNDSSKIYLQIKK